ncbi:MAG: monovalent cation/H(+) antiporter subunit G [Verrucomicrobiota bacterium]
MIEDLQHWTVAILLLIGALFIFISGVGIVRLPDFYTRLHAATKASSFGSGLILLAVALHFVDAWTAIKCVLIILFVFLTAPVGAHMLGRAAYFLRIPMWQGTLVDELKGQYDLERHTLSSDSGQDADPETAKPDQP